MRAQLLRSPGPIASSPLDDLVLGDPQPAAGELLLRVAACAVCRTDLQLVEGDLPARRLPIVPGHQIVGTVEDVGEGIEGWSPGDRAGVAWLGSSCLECEACRAGRENLCEQARFTGWDRNGGYAERVTVDARFALRLPAGFEDLAAAPLLCGGVIGYRALRIAGVEPGMRVGLYGFGASASLAIQLCVHWGCDVYVATRSEREQRRALDLGAVWAGSYAETPPRALDAAVTFAPAGSVVVDALRAVGRGGSVAINAIHLDRIPEFPYELLWWERSLRSVSNFTRRDAHEFLALAAEIPIVTAAEVHSLREANRALKRLQDGEISGAAVLVP